METWAQAAAALRSAPESVAVGRLYDNTLEDLLAVIREAPEDVERLAVVGHNPTIGALPKELHDSRPMYIAI